MSENYFYSSLSAQEIEDTLVGAVVYNSDQSLTTSQKAQARQNIGAGASDTKIIIEGFYDTLADLQAQIPVGTAGDVYAVGTASPYNLYIWDAISNTWKNNGAITLSDAVIDDEDIALDTTWSSSKINTQLGGINTQIAGKQAAISAVGMLKGTGTAVQAATLGTDYTAVDDTLASSTTKTWSVDKIVDSQAVKVLSPTFTKTSGMAVLSTVEAVQAGNTILVSFDFGTAAGNLNAGDNFVVGTLSGIPLPRLVAGGCGFSGAQAYVCALSPDGTMRIRIVGVNRTTSAASSGILLFGFTYVA